MIEDIWMGTIFGWFFGWLVCCSLQRWAETNVTLAFEDAQVMQPFSMEDIDGTDNTDDTDMIG